MLTEQEKTAVRFWLGYADLYRYRNPMLEGILEGNISPTAEDKLRAILVRLDEVDEKVFGSTANSGIKKVDEIEFFQYTQMSQIKSQGRMYVSRLAYLLGVNIQNDVFSSVSTGGLIRLG